MSRVFGAAGACVRLCVLPFYIFLFHLITSPSFVPTQTHEHTTHHTSDTSTALNPHTKAALGRMFNNSSASHNYL